MANYRGDFSELSPLAQEYFVEVKMNQDQLDIGSLWKISLWAVNRCMFSFSWGDCFHKALEPVWSWAAGTDPEGAVCTWLSCPWCPCSDCRVHPSSSSVSSSSPPPPLPASHCVTWNHLAITQKLSPLMEMGSVCFQKGRRLLASSSSVTPRELKGSRSI